MELSPELHAWSEKLRTASIALSKAQDHVRLDKDARKPSLWARIVDYLFQTKAEKSEEQAAAELANVQAQAQAFAARWIVAEAMASLANDEADYPRYLAQRERVAMATKRHTQVDNWRGLAQDAHSLLISAADECSSASTTEMIDLFSSNKAVSVISSVSTSSAADSVRKANRALQALSEALPKRASAESFALPDDFFDLLVDLAIAPSFDFLSWINMGKLNHAEDQCRKAAEKVEATLIKLNESVSRAYAQRNSEQQKLRKIAAPYLQATAERVPSSFGVSQPLLID
ncbi:hypothetical protein N0609_12505 [Pseudomonas aeruginosa]|nr:hypothetical protein [Pseudomonas aeruginosa]MCS8510184.1 hypothetical protein [Pseudomonas aeruginosa]MCS8541308.1 hypothetical protein [Pseudomonas aeruginosa]MCT0600454.1 hypothetical protein [Pseudomonas aeruginosa]